LLCGVAEEHSDVTEDDSLNVRGAFLPSEDHRREVHEIVRAKYYT